MLDRLCVFPVKGEPSDGGNNDMTLRDYFAAKVMQTLASNYHNGQSSMRRIAEDAYDMADLMMKVRLDGTDDTNT